MSNAELIHIFDNSTCLTKRQMKDYVSGIMTNEEAHAVEVHLNSCPMCSDAIEGLYEQKEGGLATMSELNGDFLKDHFGLSNPQVHLNSIAASQPTKRHINHEKKKTRTFPAWRTTSIAAALLLLVALVWFYRISRQEVKPMSEVAQNLSQQSPQVITKPGEPSKPVIAMNKPAKEPGTGKVAKGAEPDYEAAMTEAKRQADETAAHYAAADVPQMPAAAKPQTPQAPQEQVVTAYKVPLIGEDERKVITSEEVERMPTRSTSDIASTSSGVYQKSFGNSYPNNANKKEDAASMSIAGGRSAEPGYMVDGVKAKSAKEVRLQKAEGTQPDRLQQADKLYDRKSYGDALNVYNKEMQNSDYDRKAQATLGAARCYIALGNKAKAKQLLQSLIDNASGSSKRQAKRLMREME